MLGGSGGRKRQDDFSDDDTHYLLECPVSLLSSTSRVVNMVLPLGQKSCHSIVAP